MAAGGGSEAWYLVIAVLPVPPTWGVFRMIESERWGMPPPPRTKVSGTYPPIYGLHPRHGHRCYRPICRTQATPRGNRESASKAEGVPRGAVDAACFLGFVGQLSISKAWIAHGLTLCVPETRKVCYTAQSGKQLYCDAHNRSD